MRNEKSAFVDHKRNQMRSPKNIDEDLADYPPENDKYYVKIDDTYDAEYGCEDDEKEVETELVGHSEQILGEISGTGMLMQYKP